MPMFQYVRTLVLQQSAEKSFPADIVTVHDSLSVIKPAQEEVLNALIQMTNDLKDVAKTLGLDPSSLETSVFSISEHFENEEDEQGRRHMVQKGFQGALEASLSLPLDKRLLTDVLKALTPLKGNVSLSFGLSSIEKKKEEVLSLAIQKAKEKALKMADAAEIVLGPIQTIECVDSLFEEETPEPRVRTACLNAELDITPKKQRITQTVKITWGIR